MAPGGRRKELRGSLGLSLGLGQHSLLVLLLLLLLLLLDQGLHHGQVGLVGIMKP